VRASRKATPSDNLTLAPSSLPQARGARATGDHPARPQQSRRHRFRLDRHLRGDGPARQRDRRLHLLPDPRRAPAEPGRADSAQLSLAGGGPSRAGGLRPQPRSTPRLRPRSVRRSAGAGRRAPGSGRHPPG
jgi:hypothetical protein